MKGEPSETRSVSLAVRTDGFAVREQTLGGANAVSAAKANGKGRPVSEGFGGRCGLWYCAVVIVIVPRANERGE